MVVLCKRNQDICGNITFSVFVMGITNLRTLQIRRNVSLQQVMVFSQIPDPMVHITNLCLMSDYKQKYMYNVSLYWHIKQNVICFLYGLK